LKINAALPMEAKMPNDNRIIRKRFIDKIG
jgi:hypothetical protein